MEKLMTKTRKNDSHEPAILSDSDIVSNAKSTGASVGSLRDAELTGVSGGWFTQWIHMDYHNMNNFNDPTAVRYA